MGATSSRDISLNFLSILSRLEAAPTGIITQSTVLPRLDASQHMVIIAKKRNLSYCGNKWDASGIRLRLGLTQCFRRPMKDQWETIEEMIRKIYGMVMLRQNLIKPATQRNRNQFHLSSACPAKSRLGRTKQGPLISVFCFS